MYYKRIFKTVKSTIIIISYLDTKNFAWMCKPLGFNHAV